MTEHMKKPRTRGAQLNNAAPVQAKTNGIPNSALADVFAGKRRADSAMMGHQQNLAPSIAAKMSRAFGMDLTGMQVYRSDAMVGSGMQGMAQGNKVVLSSDVDLNTTAGQAILGHEISHIHAQSQGIGMGNSGLYENAALEHQADTEGLLAAQGRSIYQSGAMDMGGGMSYGLGMQGVENVTSLSGGMGASAGAPMQAKKPGEIDKVELPKPEDKLEEGVNHNEYYTKYGIEHLNIDLREGHNMAEEKVKYLNAKNKGKKQIDLSKINFGPSTTFNEMPNDILDLPEEEEGIQTASENVNSEDLSIIVNQLASGNSNAGNPISDETIDKIDDNFDLGVPIEDLDVDDLFQKLD